jgi:predicted DsbA family dithiol-disulfide isomerase
MTAMTTLPTHYTQTATKAAMTRRNNTLARNQLLIAEFNELYNTQRLRFDDVLEKIATRFGLTATTVKKILKKI